MGNTVSSSADSIDESFLVLDGELDISTRAAILNLVRDALTPTTIEIGLDLSRVDFMDCAGLVGLLQAQKLGEAHGCRVHVVAASSAVQRLLTLTDTTAALTARSLTER